MEGEGEKNKYRLCLCLQNENYLKLMNTDINECGITFVWQRSGIKIQGTKGLVII